MAPFEINPIILLFKNKVTEHEYRKWRMGMDAKFLTIMSLFAFLVQVTYGIRGSITPNVYSESHDIIRLYILAPIFLAGAVILIWVTGLKQNFKLFSTVSGIIIFVLTSCQVIFGLVDPNSLLSIYSSGLPLAIFGTALFSGLPFLWHLIYLPMVFVASFAIAVIKFPVAQVVEVAIIDSISLIMALSASYFIEYRNRLLYKSKMEISSASEFKTTLLSVLAHDVRRPLGNLGSVLKLAKAGNLSEEEFKSLINILSVDFDKISVMTADILTWIKSQFEGRRINHRYFDANELTEQITSIESEEASKKGITLKNNVSLLYNIYGDQEIIRIILRNVIVNSIKFCRQGDSVEVSINETDHHIQFVVKDTGPGFVQQQTIGQASAIEFTIGTGGEKGFGVGLRMCQDLLMSVDSGLDIYSEEGKGTIISFSFSKSGAHSAKPQKLVTNRQLSSQPRKKLKRRILTLRKLTN